MEDFENAGFSSVFVRTKKTDFFENENRVIPLTEFAQTQIRNDRWFFVFKFHQRSVNGKHMIIFQSETSNFKFRYRNVNGSYVVRNARNKCTAVI